MIPHPWAALVLVMGAYRLLRLAGWDDFPPIYKVRAWVIGERWIPETPVTDPGRCLTGNGEPCMGQCDIPSCPAKLHLPGKQPSSEVPTLRPAYGRPLLAHLIHCPFVWAGGSASRPMSRG